LNVELNRLRRRGCIGKKHGKMVPRRQRSILPQSPQFQ
jgi:hypothetical protein